MFPHLHQPPISCIQSTMAGAAQCTQTRVARLRWHPGLAFARRRFRPTREVVSLFCHQALKDSDQFRKFFHGSSPDNIQLDIKIRVRPPIAIAQASPSLDSASWLGRRYFPIFVVAHGRLNTISNKVAMVPGVFRLGR